MYTLFKRLTWKASWLATVLSLVFTVALAASGELDTTFSGDGKVTSFAVPSNPGRWDDAMGIIIQPADGKIVVAGYSWIPSTATHDFAVLRYTTGGTLDSSFSGDGRLITNFGGIDQAMDVALQSNGKIVVVGRTSVTGDEDVALARYNSGGALDTTFSGDGKQTTDFGGDNNGSLGGVAIKSSKIVVAGYMWNGTDYDFAVYRFLLDGNLDTTFSGDGMARIGFGVGRQDLARDLVIQSDGKIVVVGETDDADYNNSNFAVARLNPNGALDTTFSGDGRQITNFGGADQAYAVALQSNGRIVVVGTKLTAGLLDVALVRYNVNGSLDTTFNGTGKRILDLRPSFDSMASDLLVQSNGKIVVMGSTNDGNGNDFALVRLNNTGSFDTTFSEDGVANFDFGGDDYGQALALQPSDGKYVICGTMQVGTQRDIAVARVLP
jgi:uncharacterized delta-60 repeat protein